MTGDDVAANLVAVRDRIVHAGGDRDRVTVVAITKDLPVAAVHAAVAAGIVDVGENRAQELAAKADAAPAGVRWHFIGRLQRNKVRLVASVVHLWQSVDRLELGRAIAGRAPGAAVLAEVNVADDPAKAGVPPDDAPALVDGLRSAGLAVGGLMTIPAAGRDPRPAFARLAALADRLGLAEVSMGMSDDFEVAVEEGATIVRVGRAIFGPR